MSVTATTPRNPQAPADGEPITMKDGRLQVPAKPVIPFIEGDGTGPDIWRASQRVFDAAVDRAYGGSRRIAWMEVLAGEKAKDRLNSWLPDETLQAIAMEHALSETAFTVPSASVDADYDLRWFTPTVEVDLCGHATIAAGHVLMQDGGVRFATRSGVLTVTRNGDQLRLSLPASTF